MAINGIVAMSAYALHYHALELGPVSVVSPIGAGYAVVGVLLSIVVLGERPSALAMIGIGCSIVGAVLVSTDIKAMRAGLRQHPPGLWWAVASAIGFGVAGFTLGVVSQKTGLWQVATFASRWAMVLAFVPLAVARRGEFSRLRTATLLGVSFALIAGRDRRARCRELLGRHGGGLPVDRAGGERGVPADRRVAVAHDVARAIGDQPVRRHRLRRARACSCSVSALRDC